MKNNLSRKQGAILLIIVILLLLTNYLKKGKDQVSEVNSTYQVEEAYISRQSNIQVQGSGTVIKILADDMQGSKHQKFIVRMTDKITILISHNIDLAPRINSLTTNENISFFGEYEWNEKGGIVHWTHRDPKQRHPDGWLKYRGKIYQ
jgi:hypothetical protein